MAQSVSFSRRPAQNQVMQASNLAVAVAVSGLTTLIDLPTQGFTTLSVEIKPVTNALDQFVISAQLYPGGDYVVLFSTAGEYTTPVGLLIGTSADLTILAAAATGWFILNVVGLYGVRVEASAATGVSTVSIYAGAQ